jgi:hypothetical protein
MKVVNEDVIEALEGESTNRGGISTKTWGRKVKDDDGSPNANALLGKRIVYHLRLD